MTSEILTILGLLFLVAVGFMLFVAAPRAFARAGDSRWWALVMVVPVANLIALIQLWRTAGYSKWYLLLFAVPFGGWGLLWTLAYAEEWPVERQARMDRQASRIPPSGDPAADRLQAWLDRSQK
jgi:hypothetical protein